MNNQDGEGSILSRVAAKLEADRAALAREEEQKALRRREREAAILRDAQIRFDQEERVKRALAHLRGEIPDDPALAMNHNLNAGEGATRTKPSRPLFFGFPITSLTGGHAVVKEATAVDPRHAQLQENKRK